MTSRQGSGTVVRRRPPPGPRRHPHRRALRHRARASTWRPATRPTPRTCHPSPSTWPPSSPAAAGPGVEPLGLPALRERPGRPPQRPGPDDRRRQVHVTAGGAPGHGPGRRRPGRPGRRQSPSRSTSYPGIFDIIDALGRPAGPGRGRRRRACCPRTSTGCWARSAGRCCYVQNGPHNPTGRVARPGRLRALARVLDAHDTTVVEDSALAELTFAGRVRPELADLCRRAVVVGIGSFSKVAWGGLRIGWLRAPAPFVAAHHVPAPGQRHRLLGAGPADGPRAPPPPRRPGRHTVGPPWPRRVARARGRLAVELPELEGVATPPAGRCCGPSCPVGRHLRLRPAGRPPRGPRGAGQHRHPDPGPERPRPHLRRPGVGHRRGGHPPPGPGLAGARRRTRRRPRPPCWAEGYVADGPAARAARRGRDRSISSPRMPLQHRAEEGCRRSGGASPGGPRPSRSSTSPRSTQGAWSRPSRSPRSKVTASSGRRARCGPCAAAWPGPAARSGPAGRSTRPGPRSSGSASRGTARLIRLEPLGVAAQVVDAGEQGDALA